MNAIKKILMDRDGLSEEEADNLINEAKESFNEALTNGNIEEASNICYDYFGLEPDYIMDLI